MAEFDIEVVNGIGIATMRPKTQSGVDAVEAVRGQMAEVGRPHHIPAGVLATVVQDLERFGIKVKL